MSPSIAVAPRVLVADERPEVIQSLRLLLQGEGFATDSVGSARGVVSALEQHDYDVLIMDVDYAETGVNGSGQPLLDRLADREPTMPIVVLARSNGVEGAIDAVRRGATDFVETPWDNARLLSTLRTQVELSRALRRTQRLEGENRLLRPVGQAGLIAESRAMRKTLRLMERVAPSDANVLVTGEHGSGKEVVARWIHGASGRAEAPMVVLDPGRLPDGLFEREIFGHIRGALPDSDGERVGCFELADGGTLFLDEIATMALSHQVRLLRVLQSGEVQRLGSGKSRRVDVRVISSTNADVSRAVHAGAFREDLLYRLNTVEITVPPLRERREDLEPLTHAFLERTTARYGRPTVALAPAARDALFDHPWPGNVRELEHAIERSVLLSRDGVIQVDDLGLRAPSEGMPVLETMTLNAAEKILIQKALLRCEGNVTRAAGALGLSRSALYRRLQRHGL